MAFYKVKVIVHKGIPVFKSIQVSGETVNGFFQGDVFF